MKKRSRYRLFPCVSSQRSQATGLTTSPEASETTMPDTRTSPIQSSVRPTALGAIGAMAAAIGLLSIVALGGFDGHGAVGGVVVPPPTSSSPAAAGSAEPAATATPGAT